MKKKKDNIEKEFFKLWGKIETNILTSHAGLNIKDFLWFLMKYMDEKFERKKQNNKKTK